MTMSMNRAESDELALDGQVADQPRNRTLKASVVVLALLALVLAAALVVNATSDDDSAAPTEVTDLLDDFALAYENRDVELFETIVIDDYSFVEDFYASTEGSQDFTAAGPLHAALDNVRTSSYRVERFGDTIVAGNGPWIAAVGESWIDPFNQYDGAGLYTIVEENGTLEIAKYVWAGIKVEVQVDFDR
jgi:hypothetical protein